MPKHNKAAMHHRKTREGQRITVMIETLLVGVASLTSVIQPFTPILKQNMRV